MDFLQQTISKLESERIALMSDKEYNSVQIERCDRLINYYCLLYNKILESINSKNDSIYFYQLILDIKNRFKLPEWVERFSFISDEHLSFVIDNLYEGIESLYDEGKDLREKLYDAKKERMEFAQENEMLLQRLDMLENSISETGFGKQKVIRRN